MATHPTTPIDMSDPACNVRPMEPRKGKENSMGNYRVTTAVNQLLRVSSLYGEIDPDRVSSSEYRAEGHYFEIDEQQLLFNFIRTLFGDYVLPRVTVEQLIFELGNIDRQAALTALNMAYGSINEENEILT